MQRRPEASRPNEEMRPPSWDGSAKYTPRSSAHGEALLVAANASCTPCQPAFSPYALLVLLIAVSSCLLQSYRTSNPAPSSKHRSDSVSSFVRLASWAWTAEGSKGPGKVKAENMRRWPSWLGSEAPCDNPSAHLPGSCDDEMVGNQSSTGTPICVRVSFVSLRKAASSASKPSCGESPATTGMAPSCQILATRPSMACSHALLPGSRSQSFPPASQLKPLLKARSTTLG
mmetsp:Transcript_168518/g.541591  ORF Transcript_168518/g.541591 Transcript_168518/m.541591 type:complete len:230 (+) Transcript_168518:1353-2042(+)